MRDETRAWKVARVMNRFLLTCGPFDSLADAAERMLGANRGCLPVVASDGSRRVIGMLTDRDVALATFRDEQGGPLQVRSAMSASVVSCAPEESVVDALDRMCRHGVYRLPVVTDGGRLAGILSVSDVARWAGSAVDALPKELPREICRVLARGRPQRRVERVPAESAPAASGVASR